MNRFFQALASFLAFVLLCGFLHAQEQPKASEAGLNITNFGTLPTGPSAQKGDKSHPSKWNAAGQMFLNIYQQSRQKGENEQNLRQQLQEQFGMRSMSAGKNKSMQDYVPVFLSYDDPSALQEAERFGFIPQTKLTNMCTGLLPVKAASKIESIESVTRISVSLKQRIDNDSSRAFTNVTQVGEALWQENGLNQAYDGTGIVVGVIDIGFDYTHPTFYTDPEDPSTCRIKRVWNQNTTGGSPEMYTYGTEYSTAEEIHAAEHDQTGGYHATHVAGTAAGTGAGTQFQGMAPGSELVFVPTASTEASIFDGIAYIRSYANSVNKPCAINISMGLSIGPHDGYSDFDAAVDELVTSDPYGFLISVAAGNEGDIPLHVEANLAPGTSRSTIVEMDDPSMTYVDIWSAPGEDFAAIVFLVDEDGNILEESAAHLSTQESYSQPLPISPEQTSTVRAYPEVNSYTGKTNLFLQINALQAVADGYTVGIQLQPLSETDSVHLHAWVSEGSFSNPAPENPEWMEGNTNYTINGSIGSSQSVITVASYTSRNDWDGTLFNHNEIGEISDFSSRGPLIGGAIKPDIAAPGEIVISSGNSFLSNYQGYLLADESLVNGKEYPWIISQGTSMCTPAVTGIMALLLQQNPYLSIEDMKTLLDETAVRDAFTGETKNARWGYGKIDALAALNVLESDSVYTISVTQNDGGKIIVTHESDTVTSETQFARGTVLRLKAVPETYHFLNSWWDGNTETEREYTVARDADISATFEQETMYTVTIEQTQGGRVLVTCENDTLDSETQLPEGVLVKLYAIADENYHFSEWWDGNTTANRSMALNRDLKIKAFFDEGSANEALASHNINIYPNPSDGVFRMECPGAKEAKVFNTQGQLIQTIRESLDNFSLDMQDQQPGLYYMHIRYPQSSQTVKLVIR